MTYLYMAAQGPKCIDEGLVRLSDRALVLLLISEKISLPTTGISL